MNVGRGSLKHTSPEAFRTTFDEWISDGRPRPWLDAAETCPTPTGTTNNDTDHGESAECQPLKLLPFTPERLQRALWCCRKAFVPLLPRSPHFLVFDFNKNAAVELWGVVQTTQPCPAASQLFLGLARKKLDELEDGKEIGENLYEFAQYGCGLDMLFVPALWDALDALGKTQDERLEVIEFDTFRRPVLQMYSPEALRDHQHRMRQAEERGQDPTKIKPAKSDQFMLSEFDRMLGLRVGGVHTLEMVSGRVVKLNPEKANMAVVDGSQMFFMWWQSMVHTDTPAALSTFESCMRTLCADLRVLFTPPTADEPSTNDPSDGGDPSDGSDPTEELPPQIQSTSN